jgi:N-acetylglucosamine malate deacetylase 1
MDKLIISPHADDEALGCGGILDKNTTVLVCSIDESEFGLSVADRNSELLMASTKIGFYCSKNLDTKVNHLEITAMVNWIEGEIHAWEPEAMYIPHPGYNQDHRVVYEAAITATRPHETNFFVKKVLVYEGIQDFLWGNNTFIPNYFIPIDIEKKIKAFSFYKSQMKEHRSLDSIRQLAALRGKQANCSYAEAYKIIRWVQ